VFFGGEGRFCHGQKAAAISSLTQHAPEHAHNTAQMLAAVGGIMAFIAFHELLPLAIEHAGKSRAVASAFAGMALMSFNLYFVHSFFPID